MGTIGYGGRCIQGREVGGDYYDFLNLGVERMGIVLADIVGKGIPGALLMANLQAYVRSQCAVASPDLFSSALSGLAACAMPIAGTPPWKELERAKSYPQQRGGRWQTLSEQGGRKRRS